jgi:predicted nucleic acid-binding protein
MYLDANIIIYGYEASEPVRSVVRGRLWEWCDQQGGTLMTSLFSRLECRVLPLRYTDHALLAAYEKFFYGGSVETIDVSVPVIDLATQLRAQYGFKSPDAVHLASAIHGGAQIFLTGDVQLRRCSNIAVEVISQSPPSG